MIRLLHIYRWLKKFIIFPKQFLKLLYQDYKIDKANENKSYKYKFILIIGLPKSGTTLIEKILRSLGYIDQSTSPLRIFDNRNLKNPHDLSDNMFKIIPKNKFSFLKLHSHFTEENLALIKKYNPKVIISLRNLKDVLISRYTHILSDKTHRHHNKIKTLNTKNGFMKSLIYKNSHDTPIRPLDYFFFWIKNWGENIKKNKLKFLELKFEEFQLNKLNYLNKILKYLEIKDVDTKKILNELNLDDELLKTNNLKKNLKNFIKPQTYNIDKKIRQELNKKDIENFITSNLPK